MELAEQINRDMKIALKNKEKQKLSVLRMLKAALQNEQIKLQRSLNEEESVMVLSRELKQRKESLEEFIKAERTDLVEPLREEIAVLERYLPEQLSEEALRELVVSAVAEAGAVSRADMGKVMGILMPKVRGRADGSVVNKMVRDLLSQ